LSPSRRRRSPSIDRRRNSLSSDGIYSSDDRRRRTRSSRRTERDGGRRFRSRDEVEMKDYIRKIYSQFLNVYDLIVKENTEIRKNSVMRDAPRGSDRSDVRISRDGLADCETVRSMLRRFKADARTVGSKLNRDYREWFFKESSSSRDRDHGRSSRRDRDLEPSSRSKRYGDDYRDDRYGRSGRSDRYRDSRGDRDRGGRDRDRRSADRYDRNRSSRYERRR